MMQEILKKKINLLRTTLYYQSGLLILQQSRAQKQVVKVKNLTNILNQTGAAKASGTNTVTTASTPVSTVSPYSGATKASGTNTVNTASTPISIASPYGGLSFTKPTNADQDDLEIPTL
ncbi:hypothetical protein Tco_0284213 [Tanacetum coccineum]